MANKSRLPVSEFTLQNTSPIDLISDNFTAGELIRSEIAVRREINNWFRLDAQLQAAIFLCRNVLQPLRDEFGRFSPNSVYRCQTLERALKNKPVSWSSRSQHTLGEAADIEIPGLSTLRLAEWCRDNLLFDQIILEMVTPTDVASGWVHISVTRTANRGQKLSYVLRDGKYIYVTGFVSI